MKTSILPLHLSTKRSSRISKSSLSLLWRSVIKIGFLEATWEVCESSQPRCWTRQTVVSVPQFGCCWTTWSDSRAARGILSEKDLFKLNYLFVSSQPDFIVVVARVVSPHKACLHKTRRGSNSDSGLGRQWYRCACCCRCCLSRIVMMMLMIPCSCACCQPVCLCLWCCCGCCWLSGGSGGSWLPPLQLLRCSGRWSGSCSEDII